MRCPRSASYAVSGTELAAVYAMSCTDLVPHAQYCPGAHSVVPVHLCSLTRCGTGLAYSQLSDGTHGGVLSVRTVQEQYCPRTRCGTCA
eukprot:100728-Rhodomonas_salina.1